MTNPEVSVLLPVHNAGPFLGAALASLSAQESVRLEVIVVDDGSTDGSRADLIAASKRHPWLRVLTQEQSGVARTLNRAFHESRGEFIARMDADDVAEPDRFRRQIEFLRREPSVGVCGSWFRILGSRVRGVIRTPVADAGIRARLVFGSAFAHPSVMLRRVVLEGLSDLYDPRQEGFEDYGLWLRLAQRTRLHNLPHVLLHYRMHPGQITRSPDPARRRGLEMLRRGLLESHGMQLSEVEARAHDATAFDESLLPAPSARIVETWLLRVSKEFPASGWCEATHLRRECADAWWRYLRRHIGGLAAARMYWRSGLAHEGEHRVSRVLRLALFR